MSVKSFLKRQQSFIITVLILFSVRWSFADQYRVPSGSMQPTVQVGDHIAVNKMAYDFKVPFTEWQILKLGEPKRGDIVVFKYPKDETVNYVKRLIGLPGDHIQIKNGFIEINGKAVEVGRNDSSTAKSYYEIWQNKKVLIRRISTEQSESIQEFDVPDEMYFFMGDNRDNSFDSRFWGFVPRKNLKGRAEFVLWNINLGHPF